MQAPARTPSERPAIPAPAVLRPLLQIIAERMHPLEIWLFGSRARGDNRPDSDWDLLAVVPDDASSDFDDPLVAWQIVKDSGLETTLLVTRKGDLAAVWGRVNTLGYDLAREGLRIDVR